jgi:hypothetical protein
MRPLRTSAKTDLKCGGTYVETSGSAPTSPSPISSPWKFAKSQDFCVRPQNRTQVLFSESASHNLSFLAYLPPHFARACKSLHREYKSPETKAVHRVFARRRPVLNRRRTLVVRLRMFGLKTNKKRIRRTEAQGRGRGMAQEASTEETQSIESSHLPRGNTRNFAPVDEKSSTGP